MKYLITLLILIPLTSTAQNIGIYIDTAGQVAIGNDTVWEPFQVFAEAGPQLQLDQQSAEMGNTAGLLITAGVENGQSFTCGLTGQLASVSLRLGTVPDAGNTMLEMHIRDGSAPTGPILTTSSFAISDDEMQWYDIAVTPFIDVMAGDEFFIEVVHTGGDQAEWDWVDGTNPYSGGTSWQNQTSWFEITSSDFVFRTYVIAAETTDVLSVTSTGKVKINDYLLPQFDGLTNQVMVTNGTGVLSWEDMTVGGGGALIQDADGDTKVQVEESADDDIIRFDMGGTEYFRMEEGRLGVFNTGNSIILGENAGVFDNFANKRNIFIGNETGYFATGNQNTAIGHNAYTNNGGGAFNTAIGSNAMQIGNSGSENTGIGYATLQSNSGSSNTAVGVVAMLDNTSGGWNTSIGHSSLLNNTTGHFNTGVGWGSGFMNSTGGGNVFLGHRSGYFETGSEKLYIENSEADATEALIYGEFDNNLLRINGTLNINNAYSFPTTDGSLGQVLQTDGGGLLSWQTVSGGGGGSSIEDTDGDTKIQTEEVANEDIIRFDMGGTEHFVMAGPRLEVKNSGSSVFLGQGAGANDDLTNRSNTFIGYQSGLSSVDGEHNSAIGAYAFEASVTGSYNTVHGVHAMRNSTGGESNSAFGYRALQSNTSSSNVAIGASALSSNLDGHANVGMGSSSLTNNTSGDHNTAIGTQALFSNKAGSRGTAIGYHAMLYANNTTASFENYNVAVGYEALKGSGDASTNTGNANTAIGYQALVNNSSGSENTVVGNNVMVLNTEGDENIALGNNALTSNRAGSRAVAIGYNALSNAYNTSVNFINTNIAIGYEALKGSPTASANNASNNVAIGYQSLLNNTTGSRNITHGSFAMWHNSMGSWNTAVGDNALFQNTMGNSNTVLGSFTMHGNGTGSSNVAIGRDAMLGNFNGNENTAIGGAALLSNLAGHGATAIGFKAMEFANNTNSSFDNQNVAVGYEALRGSTSPMTNTGNGNTAIGYRTLHTNTSGSFNTASGVEALLNNEGGLRNTATGHSALKNNIDGDNNTAVGIFAMEFNESGSNNTAIGYSASSNSGDYSNTTGIGHDADPTASNRVHIGNNSVSWIGGQVGWATYSDGRFKSDITEEVVGLDFINQLRPVTYNIDLDEIQDWKALHYNERDSSDYPEKYEIETYRFSGFVAQEVESASRNTGYDFSGVCTPKNEADFYSLRYAEFVVPLVKAVQELSAENEALKAQNQQFSDLLLNLQQKVAMLEME